MTLTYDAAIVGGGHNGLVAAHYLAAAGLSVVVLERRERVGGLCAPIEFFPGYRGAITNSPGSLEPKVVRDMQLEKFGLAFDRPDPTVLIPFPDGRAFVGWRDRERGRAQVEQFSKHDADAYPRLIEHYNDFARRLGVSVFAPPPSLRQLVERLVTPQDEADFAAVMLGSMRDLLDEHLHSDQVKAVLGMLATAVGNVGPSTPGSAIGLLPRPLSMASSVVEASHDPRQQPLRGSTGLPRGGMGAVAEAMEASVRAQGVVVRTGVQVDSFLLGSDNEVRGVVLAGGEEVAARRVLSNLNPRTTLLDLLPAGSLPADLEDRLRARTPRGAAFKLVLALDDLPRFTAAPAGEEEAYASCQFRIGPSLDYLDRGFDDYRYGRWSRSPQLWGLTPSVVDPSLAPPGRHLMSVNVWYAPYHLQESDWDVEGDRFGKHCIQVLSEYAPNVPDAITDYRVYTPVDLEREFGLLEGHQLHGDMTLAGMFSWRPVPGLSDYRTPVEGLYLCGAGTWPGGYVTGIPGHNASAAVLSDLTDPSRAGDDLMAGLS
ncbi:MAG: oxidoreductase [Blastococcus sp.]|jgi:phytoene dehydrogenase-like protein|nr:oxidoreductase [Blastococcus sp.]